MLYVVMTCDCMVLSCDVEGVAHLQSHSHWILDMAIQMVTAIAEGQDHVV